MEEDETPDVRNPDYADTIRHSDERIRTALQSARTMSLLFMEGKFEQAIEEATNTLIRCIEAINLLVGQPSSSEMETFATFQDTFLLGNQESGPSTRDWIFNFTSKNRGLLGRDFEEDLKTAQSITQNQNIRVDIAHSPKDARTLVIKLSGMSHKLLLYAKKLRERILSREAPQNSEKGLS